MSEKRSVGFLLVKVEPGKERQVYQNMISRENVIEAYPLFGDRYDILLKVLDPIDGLESYRKSIEEAEHVKEVELLKTGWERKQKPVDRSLK